MDEPKKMRLASMDVMAQKRDQLKSIFPEVFSEGKIDFDQLKRALGELVESGKERFGLSWPGKANCMRVIEDLSFATLKPARDESVDFDKTENLFIEGDNLEVLKLLGKAYFGKVKMIYIDPPYNTGNDFIYPDKFSESLGTYLSYTGQIDEDGHKLSSNTDSDGRFHSNWLNMMYPRLFLARNLLCDDGVIFISIDNNEQAHLRKICDEIFGEENFIEAIIWRKKSGGGQQDDYMVTEHDYILCYGRNKSNFSFIEKRAPINKGDYKLLDSKKRRYYKLVKLAKWGSGALREDRPTMYDYPELVDPDGNQSFPVSPDNRPGRWRYGKQRVIDLIENDEIYWKKNNVAANNVIAKWIPYEKDYEPLSEEGGILKERSIFYDIAENTSGANELKNLFGVKDVFQNPKPSDLIVHLIHLVSESDDDVILDFFAGSCTTAHSVMALNKIDAKKRVFITVQLLENLDKKNKGNTTAFSLGYKNIADIGKERIRRAARKIKADHPDYKGDVGFKTFKLAPSNFKKWQGNVDQIDNLEEQLFDHIEHIDAQSSQEDILYELLLKVGFALTTKIEKITLAEKEVFSIEKGAMFICLDEKITQELIDAMAEARPERVICLDKGFQNNDQLKANAVQTFKTRAKEQDIEIWFRTV